MKQNIWKTSTLRRALLVMGMGAMLSTSALAATKIRYADLGPPKGWRAESLIEWAEKIKTRTKGEVEVKFFWSQSLLKAKDTLKGVGSGLADSGSVFGVYSPASMPLWNIANSPNGTGDIWVGTRTWQEMFKTYAPLKAEADKNKIEILAVFSAGASDILTREKPVTSASDLDGMKIRSSGGWTGMLKNLGASTVSIGFGELYQALDKGIVDGTMAYIPATKNYKLYEVASHLTEVQLGQVLGYGLGINKKLMDGFSAETQAIIRQASDEFQDEAAKRYYAELDETKAQLSAGIDGKKVTFHSISDEQRAGFLKAGEGFTATWKEKVQKAGGDPDALLAALAKIQQKYENEVKTKGYPWAR